MGQDMAKGRRTEIEFLNGFVVREGVARPSTLQSLLR
jgi:ketopantoate reductase